MAKDKETLNSVSSKKTEKGSAPKGSKQKPASSGNSVGARIVGYLKGVVQELKRVTWPTPHEMLNSGIIVVVTLIFFALFTFAFDSLATRGVTALAQTTSGSTETSSTPSSTETSKTPSTEATVTAPGAEATETSN